MMGRGSLYVISGPSGAGKGTLVKELRDRVSGIWVSVSATTRPPRPGEKEGVHYFFLTHDEFEKRLHAGEFLEHAVVHGNSYGTLRAPVERRMGSGVDVVLEIDPQGAMQVKQSMSDSILVFIVAPSVEDLRRRLEGRGSETETEVATRMRTSEREMGFAGEYDYVINNDDVRRATDELVSIIRPGSDQGER